MTGVETFLLGLVIVVGFYAAWNIGANDVANAMGTSVGSGALTLRRAVILAAIFEFLGAYLVGANVAETVRKKMFDPEVFQLLYADRAALLLACAMIAALFASGTWLLIASYFGWPVSTTHSIVGAVVGVGVAALGAEHVAWAKVGIITAGWIVSPIMSAAIAFILFRALLHGVFFKRDPLSAAKRVAPYLVFVVLVVLVGVATFKGLKPLWKTMGINPMEARVLLVVAATAVALATVGMFVTVRLVRDIRGDGEAENPLYQAQTSRSLGKAITHLRRVRDTTDGDWQKRATELLAGVGGLRDSVSDQMRYQTDSKHLQQVERVFAYLQVLTACFVAFAHGSNDVANAIGPMSAAYQAIMTGQVTLSSGVPGWALALGGLGIVAGLAVWGWRVMETIGKRITELTPSRGFTAEFAAAITILLASVLPFGLPVSTTHILVGAVLGVGLARGIASLDLSVTGMIFASWFVTIPAGATLAIVFYYCLKLVVF